MASESPKVRPLTEADIWSFYNEPFVQSLRGIAVEFEGKPVAVAFVINTSPPQAVSWIRDELREYPRAIIKAAREFAKILKRYPCDVYAMADEDEANSENFLKRVGFEHWHERAYVWVN